MHYFQFEIKEWLSNTAHLTLEEEAIYLRLVNYYYDSEKPISADDIDKIYRKLRIHNAEVASEILDEFFVLTKIDDDFLYIHKRCEQEIAKYHAKCEQASKAGKASAQRKTNGRSTDAQPIINQESLIINQKSVKNISTPKGVSESVFKDYLEVRKSKKAKWTETVCNGLKREAAKANMSLEQVMAMCCERNWVGFKAEWVKDKQTASDRGNAVMLGLTRGLVGGGNNGLLSK